MSQIQIQKIICSSSTCDRPLTEYEIKRLTHRWNRFRLCNICRRGHRRLRITSVDCAKCGKGFANNDTSLYCKECQRVRVNELHLKRYHATKQLKEKRKGINDVLDVLKNHDTITVGELQEILGMSSHCIRTHIYNLRHYRRCDIETSREWGYRLK